jgi:DNA-binding CsgD family transcriptional regulator
MTRPTTRRHSRKKLDKALDMLREGKSRSVVSRRLRIAVSTLGYHAKVAGIMSPRSYYGHRVAFRPGSRPFTPADDATIVSHVAAGKNFQAIGRALGRHRSSIRSRILTLQQIEQRGDDDNA